MIKKIIIVLTGLIMIALGSFFEVNYYRFRFVAEGDNIFFAIAKGAALVLLLMVISVKRKDWRSYIIIIPLLAFSIWCTSAGQATGYAQRRNESTQKEETVKARSEETEKERVRLQKELEQTSALLSEKQKERDNYSPDKRQQWSVVGKDSDGDPIYEKKESSVFTSINNEIAAYQNRISIIEKEIKDLPDIVIITDKRETDPFEILEKRLKIPSAIVQYISQAAFSLFSALIAPFGLNMILSSGGIKREKKEEKKAEPFDWLQVVSFWVTWSWYPVRNNKGLKLLNEESLLQIAGTRGVKIDKTLYDRIKKAAFESGAIDASDSIVYTDQQVAIEAIIRTIKRGERHERRKHKG